MEQKLKGLQRQLTETEAIDVKESQVPDSAAEGSYNKTLFIENRDLRKALLQMKELQAKREKDHLDHIEWMHQDCYGREKRWIQQISKLEEQVSEMK